MSLPTKHPSETTLLCYAARTIDQANGYVVEQHVASCPECARIARFGEKIGAALTMDLPDAPLPAGALEDALARIRRPRPPRAQPPALDMTLSNMHFARPGIRYKILWAQDGGFLALLTMQPGSGFPEHEHKGLSTMLALRGSFRDDGGEYIECDLAESGPGITHAVEATGTEPCVCLFGLEHGYDYTHWHDRLYRRIVGI